MNMKYKDVLKWGGGIAFQVTASGVGQLHIK